jgi:hypothetical protein
MVLLKKLDQSEPLSPKSRSVVQVRGKEALEFSPARVLERDRNEVPAEKGLKPTMGGTGA